MNELSDNEIYESIINRLLDTNDVNVEYWL